MFGTPRIAPSSAPETASEGFSRHVTWRIGRTLYFYDLPKLLPRSACSSASESRGSIHQKGVGGIRALTHSIFGLFEIFEAFRIFRTFKLFEIFNIFGIFQIFKRFELFEIFVIFKIIDIFGIFWIICDMLNI